MKELKNLKFKSVIPQDILQATSLLEKLGYEVVRNDFSADDAAKHNGICAWDDGEITEGWLDDDNFEQVTLEDLKKMVGETNKGNTTLSNNFSVAWEQVFGEKFVDSVIKAVKHNKENSMKNDTFTLERLLGCEVLFENRYQSSKGYITSFDSGCSVTLNCGVIITLPNMYNLTFFTEDGNELTFDEYVQLYYPEG